MKNLKPSVSNQRGNVATILISMVAVAGVAFMIWLTSTPTSPPPAATALAPANNLPGTPLFNIKEEIQEFKIVGGAVDEAYNQDSTGVVAVYGVRKGEEDKGHNRFIILDFTPINPDGITTVWAKQAVISGPGPTSSIWLRVNKRN